MKPTFLGFHHDPELRLPLVGDHHFNSLVKNHVFQIIFYFYSKLGLTEINIQENHKTQKLLHKHR